MLPFRWAFLGAAFLIAFTNAASIHAGDRNPVVGALDQSSLFRTKRSGRGYARGQTQSQYLNFGKPEQDGKAEAEANESGSRSTVAGTHGMGQAQSQFSFGDCSDCTATQIYEYPSGSPDPLTYIGGSNGIDNTNLLRPGSVAGTQTGPGAVGVGQPNTIPQYPSTQSGGIIQSGQVSSGSRPSQGQMGSGQPTQNVPPGVPGSQLSGTQFGGSGPPGSRPLLGGSQGTQFGVPGAAGSQPFVGGQQVPQPGGPRAAGGQSFIDGQQGTQFGGPGASGSRPLLGGPQGTQFGVPGTAGSQQFVGGQQVPQPGGPGAPGTQSFPGGQQVGHQFGEPGATGSRPLLGGQPSTNVGIPGTQPSAGGQQGTQYGIPGPSGSQQFVSGQQGTQLSGPGAPGSQMFVNGQQGTQFGGPGNRQFVGGQGSTQTGRPGQPFVGGQQGNLPSQGVGGGGGGGGGVYTAGPQQGSFPQQPDTGSRPTFGTPGGQYIPGTGAVNGHPQTQLGVWPNQVQGTIGSHAGDSGPTGGRQYPGGGVPGIRPGIPGTIQPLNIYGEKVASQPGGSYRPDTDRQITSAGVQTIGSTGTTDFQQGSPIKQRGHQGGQGAIFSPEYGRVWQQGGAGSDIQHPIGTSQGQLFPGTQPGGMYAPGIGVPQVQPSTVPDGTSQRPYGPGHYVPQPGFDQQQPQGSFGQRPVPEANVFAPSPGTIPVQGVRSPQGVPYTPNNAQQGGIYVTGIPSDGSVPTGAVGSPSGGIQQGGTYDTQTGINYPGTPNSGSQQSVYGTGVSGIPGSGTQPTLYGPGAGKQPGTYLPGSGTQRGVYTPASGSPQGAYGPDSVTQQGIYVPSTGMQQGAYGPGTAQQSGIYGPGAVAQQGPGMGRPQTVFGPGTQQDNYGHRVDTQHVVQGTPQGPGGVTQQTVYTHGTVGQQTGPYRPDTGLQQPGSYSPGNMYSPGFQPVYTPGIVSPQGGVSPGTDSQSGIYRPSGSGIQDGRQFIPGGAERQGTSYAPSSGSGSISGTQQSGRDSGQPGLFYGAQPGSGYPSTGIQQGNVYGTGTETTYGQGPQQAGVPGIYQQPRGSGGVQQSGIGGSGATGISYPVSGPGGAGVATSGGPSNLLGTSGTSDSTGGSDDAFSQAESAITNGEVSASAQGKKNGGTAKTQVSGTYTATGTFSASAMTADSDRSANAQVSGSSEGAMSQSQGHGGAAQSQAQVQVNGKNGGTKASSQSGGIIHQSQSEVQANDKGGLADAQSNGPGQTSSQAQIGFRPRQDGTEINSSTGGGQASAQSGSHSGQSQSQIQGQSKYGVSYHGAAQSASGTKEQVASYREQNRQLFHSINQFGSNDGVTDRVDTMYGGPALTSESDGLPDLQLKTSKTSKETASNKVEDDDGPLPEEEDEEDPYDEYEDEEDYYNEKAVKMDQTPNGSVASNSMSAPDASANKDDPYQPFHTYTQNSPSQKQEAAVADPSDQFSLVQNQNGRVQRYPLRTTTETVPNGFRGTVNIEKKFHTKSLEPHKSDNKVTIEADNEVDNKTKLRTPDSYVTVTKSVTGSMDNSKNPPEENKNFQSTYYTKSSTCGYFTFSCNIVYGANGRSKICRPKAPTNGKC